MRTICSISFWLLIHIASANAIALQQVITTSKYAIDPYSKWKKTDLGQQQFHKFKAGEKIDIGYNKNSAVWCYINLKNTSKNASIEKWLCFDNYHIDSLTIYDGNKEVIMGDRTATPSLFLQTHALAIKLNPNQSKTLWVRLKKQTSYFDFSYHLSKTATLQANSAKKIAFIAFFVGIAFLLMMINGILFIMTKNRIYSYYICYSLLTVIYAVVTTNFAKHLLLPQFLFFSEARIFTGALWYIALSYFLSCFLKLKENQPLKYRLIKLLCQINLTLVFLSLSCLIFFRNFNFKYFFLSGYIVFMMAIVVLFWAAIAHLRIEKKQGVYALLAFAPQLIWGGCLFLKTFGLIPISFGDNWMVFASLYEVFLFGFVLSTNYVDVFFKNNQLMLEVIREKESSLKTINSVQLRERRNIANIIHDNVGSKIAYIMLLFDMKNTKQAKETLTELASDIRQISHQILPKALDDGALASGLASQIKILNASLENTTIELFCYDFPEKIEEKWVYDLYLIALEVINNAVKHGKANLITIEFYKYTNHYHFQFTDTGLGFDIKQTSQGFGLDNIKKRIHAYGGDTAINSTKNQGTIIQINLPF